jgi:hypothetical protein
MFSYNNIVNLCQPKLINIKIDLSCVTNTSEVTLHSKMLHKTQSHCFPNLKKIKVSHFEKYMVRVKFEDFENITVPNMLV